VWNTSFSSFKKPLFILCYLNFRLIFLPSLFSTLRLSFFAILNFHSFLPILCFLIVFIFQFIPILFVFVLCFVFFFPESFFVHFSTFFNLSFCFRGLTKTINGATFDSFLASGCLNSPQTRLFEPSHVIVTLLSVMQ